MTQMHTDEMLVTMTHRYEKFIERVREQDPNAAAEEFGKFCHWLRRTSLKLHSRSLAAFAEAWIDLFWQMRRFDMMLKAAEDAQGLFGEDLEWTFARGEALFNLGRFEEARAALEALTTEDFDEPMLYFLLACLAERRGEDDDALRLFETAHRLSSKEFTVPIPLTEEEAISMYEECLVDLPEPIAWHLKDVPIYVSPLPSDELILLGETPLDPLIMGLFMGQPRGAGESSWPEDQPRILLFHKNIAKFAGDFETLEDELRKTLFHEVGHFLGFSEDQLEEMGLA